MAKEGGIIIPTENEIIRIHNYLVGAHNGLKGILNPPGYVTGFCEQYLSEAGITPNLAFILSRLAKGHYFNDGNKRTAYFTGRYAALRNGFDFNGTSPEEAADQMKRIAELDDERSRKYARRVRPGNFLHPCR